MLRDLPTIYYQIRRGKERDRTWLKLPRSNENIRDKHDRKYSSKNKLIQNGFEPYSFEPQEDYVSLYLSNRSIISHPYRPKKTA